MRIAGENMNIDKELHNKNNFISHKKSKEFSQSLLVWYHDNRRQMPWREEPSPYRIWISEIMLQQTRVDTVIPYFNRFMERYPDILSLASSDEEELLKYWEGLGYYSRIRNIYTTAKNLVQNYQGQLPGTYDELIKLKGIGDYTAGAIASEAFGERVAAVDGNVFRVMARLSADSEDLREISTQKRLKERVNTLLPNQEVGDFNQAFIELGALICLPRGLPKCDLCPVNKFCLAKARGQQLEIPFKSKAKKRRIENRTVFLLYYEKEWAILKREEGRFLEGLYEFPSVEGHVDESETKQWLQDRGLEMLAIHGLKARKVIFSHIEWHLKSFLIKVNQTTPDMIFDTISEIKLKYPMASAFVSFVNEINGPSQLSINI